MTLLLFNLLTTSMLAGLIWFVQVVHYPLFEEIGEAGWKRYHDHHARRTTTVVAPRGCGCFWRHLGWRGRRSGWSFSSG
jgi:hypothetical protein